MEGTLDQQQQDHLQIQPEDRFRAGEHTDGLDYSNPALRPHGITDAIQMASSPAFESTSAAIVDPAANANQIDPAANANQIDPAANANQIDPAANANQIDPASPANSVHSNVPPIQDDAKE